MIRFSHKNIGGYDVLTLEAYKADVEVFFYSGDVSHIHIDEREFMPTEDLLYGVFVQIRPKNIFEPATFHSLQEILSEAESQYPGIMREIEDEERSYGAMERELSSPEATGRI